MKKLIIFSICFSLLSTSCSSNKRYSNLSYKDLPPLNQNREYKKIRIVRKKSENTNFEKGVITGHNVNIRSGPSENSYAITQYNKRKEILIVGEKSGWLKIQTGQNRTGWVWSAYVKRNGKTVNSIKHKGDLLIMTDASHCIGPDGTSYVINKKPASNKTESYQKKNTQFISPIQRIQVTSPYGKRLTHPVYGGPPGFHAGIDLRADVGTPIYSPSPGVILSVNRGNNYGLYIDIKHPNGYASRLAHLSKILVKKGEKIEQGQKIALTGNTGRTTGPHLHFEIFYLGRNINPTTLIDF